MRLVTTDPDPTLPDLGPLGRPEVGPRSASEYLWDMYDVRMDDVLWDRSDITIDENGDLEVGATAAERGEGACSTLARKGKCELALLILLLAALPLALVIHLVLLPSGGYEPNAAGPENGPGNANLSVEISMLPSGDNGPSAAGPRSGLRDANLSMEISMPPSGVDEPITAQLGSGWSGDAKQRTDILVSNIGDGQQIVEGASQGAIAGTSEDAYDDSSEDASEDTSEDMSEEAPGSNHNNHGEGQPLVPGGHVPSGALQNFDGIGEGELQAQWQLGIIPSYGDDEGRQQITEDASQGAAASTSEGVFEDSSEYTSEDSSNDVEPEEMPGSNHNTSGGGQPLVPGGYVPINGSDEGDLQALWNMRIIP